MAGLEIVDQGVVACASYAGPAAQWVRFAGLAVVLFLVMGAVAFGMACERGGWGKWTAVAAIALMAAVGAVDWRIGDLERAVAGLCSRTPLFLETKG